VCSVLTVHSTGVRGRIQCSQSTAEALTIAGKEHWVRPREDVVTAKGKGIMKTFWVVPNSKAHSQSASSDSTGRSEFEDLEIDTEMRAQGLLKREREIDWVTVLLSDCIRQIVAKQKITGQQKTTPQLFDKTTGHIPMDDIVEAFRLPETTFKTREMEERAKTIKIPEKIHGLLRQYVSVVSTDDVADVLLYKCHFTNYCFHSYQIASAYNNHAFHNFAHACHVVSLYVLPAQNTVNAVQIYFTNGCCCCLLTSTRL